VTIAWSGPVAVNEQLVKKNGAVGVEKAASTSSASSVGRGDLSVRQGTDLDLDGIAAVSLAAGQPSTGSGADPAYTRLLLDGGSVFVAVRYRERIVGWGATWPTPLGDVLSDLFVDPACHGEGIGRRLLGHLWPEQPHGARRLTFASRHPSALPLYAAGGLRPIWPLLYLTGDPHALPVSETVRAEVVTADVAAIAEAALIAGAPRPADYRYWAERGKAVLVRDHDRIIAVGAGTEAELAHLTYAGGSGHATAALVAALTTLGGSTSTVCLPGPHPALAELLAHGWRIEDYDLAMSTPDLDLPHLWAYSPGLA
jgi:GNAT superfamily N-acetyltransferase